MADRQTQPRVFFDSSVLIAGSFSLRGASHILLQLSALTLLDGRISPDVREEAERNISKKIPAALPQLRILLKEAVVEGAPITEAQWRAARPYAHEKDVAILGAALAQDCHYLVTLNAKDFWPPEGGVEVLRPAELLHKLRLLLMTL